MPSKEQTFMGKKIKITGSAKKLTITIDGQAVDVDYDTKSKTYNTPHLPYAGYQDAEKLAQELVRSVPDFL